MPRQARLDAPGTLHHVMARGIERTDIFRNSEDKNDFLKRLAEYSVKCDLFVYAWALIPNHFHLLIRTGKKSLADSMRKILTGYVVNFNRRYSRTGHLFQNRYKSIVCEHDPYLLELTRYIHLNPLRAGLVKNMNELNHYPFSGHSVIMGEIQRDWQETKTILRYFGTRRPEAIKRYEEFIKEGINSQPQMTGGGILRSLGGWSEVSALRKKRQKAIGDERILGRAEFVEQIIKEAEDQHKKTLKLKHKNPKFSEIAKEIEKEFGISEEELRSATKTRMIVKGRKLFCQIAIRQVGHSGAEAARYLNVTTSAVNRLAVAKFAVGTEKIFKLF